MTRICLYRPVLTREKRTFLLDVRRSHVDSWGMFFWSRFVAVICHQSFDYRKVAAQGGSGLSIAKTRHYQSKTLPYCAVTCRYCSTLS